MKESKKTWHPPQVNTAEVRQGDMPGDQVQIDESHIKRANRIFPPFWDWIRQSGKEKVVLSVYGGSGVGKSEIGSLLAHYCGLQGLPAYTLSGDNYPRRIPSQNDEERLNTFRSSGLAALGAAENFRDEWDRQIHDSWEDMTDADPEKAARHEAFRIYQEAGREALEAYLGTEKEIDFPLVNQIIHRFKGGAPFLALKRMGRTPGNVHFASVEVKGIAVLVIEWTHGNNPRVEGVDYPVFLYSTPEETLAHRLSRGRDKGVDSAFTHLVLDIEQANLNSQAEKAALIVGKNGNILSYESFRRLAYE